MSFVSADSVVNVAPENFNESVSNVFFPFRRRMGSSTINCDSRLIAEEICTHCTCDNMHTVYVLSDMSRGDDVVLANSALPVL